MKERYDIIVVGAGPVGSMAAREAASGGASVLLLDRKTVVGDPIRCGEVIGEKSMELLVPLDERWIVNRIHSACLISPSGHQVFVDNIGAGLVLDRMKFDQAVAGMAQQRGVELALRQNVTGLLKEDGKVRGVEIKDRDGRRLQIRCNLVIAADGVDSRAARWAGLETATSLEDIETCVQYMINGVEWDPDILYFYMGMETAPEGYLWVFPRGKGLANVGIGISGRCAKNQGPVKYLDQFIQRHFPGSTVVRRDVGGVTVCPSLSRLCAHGFMVAGDAARQVNCMNGGGIFFGMMAGRLAGETAARAVQKGDFSESALSDYPRRWFKTLGSDQKRSYRLKQAVLAVSDETKDKIAFRLHNRRRLSYFSVFKSVFGTKPLLLLKLFLFFR